MTLSLCLFGLLLCNNVIGKPILDEEFCNESEIQHHEDSFKNSTTIIRNEGVSTEIRQNDKNITSEFVTNTMTAEDLIDNIASINDMAESILYLNEDLNIEIGIFGDNTEENAEIKDFSAEEDIVFNETPTQRNDQAIVIDEHGNDQFSDLVTKANQDQGIVVNDDGIDVNQFNDDVSAEDIENTDANSNETPKITTADEYERMLLSIVEADVVETLEDIERSSRAVDPGTLQFYVPDSATVYRNYNSIGRFGNINQSNQIYNRIVTKQGIPVKGRVKIARTFTDFNWKMPPTFTSKGVKEKQHRDNIASESKPLRSFVSSPGNPVSLPAHTGYGQGGNKSFLGKVPVSGKFTVAATFC